MQKQTEERKKQKIAFQIDLHANNNKIYTSQQCNIASASFGYTHKNYLMYEFSSSISLFNLCLEPISSIMFAQFSTNQPI